MKPTKEAVLAHAAALAEAWNEGSLEKVCEFYATDAVMLSHTAGLISGRFAIFEKYREENPDPKLMGTIELEMLQSHGFSAASSGVSLVSAIFKWTLTKKDQGFIGHSLVTYGAREGKLFILQDASIGMEIQDL